MLIASTVREVISVKRFKSLSIGLSVGIVSASLLAPVQAAEEEEAGNNLSYPVIWAETDGRPTIPGVYDTDMFGGQILEGTLGPDSTETCWGAVQKDLGNSWQAETMDAPPDHAVTTIDWGDNLEVKDWNIGKPVRVETGLYDNTLDATMKRYEMCYIGGQGQTEVWGALVSASDASAKPSVIDSTDAMVYTSGARLTIQRIDDPAQASWDAAQRKWVGKGAAEPVFNSAVYEKTSDGPGSYGAELNVQGKVVYGFNWATDGLYNGEYRLTFSLDGPSDAFPTGSGTSLNGATILPSSEEEEEVTISDKAGGAPGGGNTAVVDGAKELTYIDVALSGGQNPPPIDDDGDGDGGGTTPPPGDTGTTGTTGGNGQPVITGPLEGQKKKQQAKLKAPKSGKYRLGRVLVLAKGPVKTNAGETVRWRVREQSRDNCKLRIRDGKTTLRLRELGKCRILAYAPAPTPEFLRYEETRTYRIVAGQ